MNWLLLFFAPMLAQAEPPLLSCHAKRADYSARLELSAAGIASLEVVEGEKKFRCSLMPIFLEDQSRHLVSGFEFRFRKESCSPIWDGGNEITFPHLWLQVRFQPKDKHTGRMQWLRKFQPDRCELRARRSLLRKNIALWKKGLWGRKPAPAN